MTKMIKVQMEYDKGMLVYARDTEFNKYVKYLPYDEYAMNSLFLVDRENFLALVEKTDSSKMTESIKFFDTYAKEPNEMKDAERLSVYNVDKGLTYVYAVTERFYDSSDKEYSKVVFLSLDEKIAREYKEKQKGNMFSVEVMALESALVED